MQDRQSSNNCAINNPTMIRNICILSLFVLSVQASGMNPAEAMNTVKNVGTHLITSMQTCMHTVHSDLKNMINPAGALTAFKCAAFCISHGVGIVDEKGNMHQHNANMVKNGLQGTIFEGAMNTMINTCSGKGNGNNSCEGTFQTLKCGITAGPMQAVIAIIMPMVMPMVMSSMG